VDPVKRYLSYEQAFLRGELDPAFGRMTAWECRLITDSDAPDEQIQWCREMLRNYRPDIIFESDYRWRYSKIVRTDVTYQTPEWISTPHTYPQILNGGGKCGPRAWFGRLALRSFGIPTWGVRQTGHAALSHWTPDGWVINFGADWEFNWWEDRPGPDFLLETRAREHPADFLKVLRAQWIADALGEQKYQPMRPGSGGLWNVLALNLKRAIVAEAKPARAKPGMEAVLGLERPTRAEIVANAPTNAADRQMVVDENGVITIPAVACVQSAKSTPTILFMNSFAGGRQIHLGHASGKAESLEYSFNAPRSGQYRLNARVATVKRDQRLMVTVNGAGEPADLAMPYTEGRWQMTVPTTIALQAGSNRLVFTRKVPCAGLTIKEFVLTPVE
jgi:hypothetical protein